MFSRIIDAFVNSAGSSFLLLFAVEVAVGVSMFALVNLITKEWKHKDDS